MTITTLPTPPSRSDSPDTFASRADALLGALPTFVTEANALQADVTSKQTAAATSATNASTSATNAATSASTATTQAGTATTQAAAATANATAAAASQSLVAASASAASASAASAAASASSAQTNADRAITAWASATSPAETLAAISKSVHSGSIVKAIIGDTSKDSDGGSFRKRCAHTSWYNEAVPSGLWLGQAATAAAAWLLSGAVTGAYFQNSTDGLYYQLGASSPSVSAIRRGAARELPAVFAACIGAAGLSIYDLTQTNTPIWRFFPVGANEVVFATPTSVAYVNGKLAVATGSGIVLMDFIADSAVKISTAADSKYKGRIADATSGWN